MHKLVLVALAVSAMLGLAACSQDQKGLGDAGVGHRDDHPRDVIVMPDLFANVAMVCDGHGHRIYVTTRDAAPVVIEDPSCPKT